MSRVGHCSIEKLILATILSAVRIPMPGIEPIAEEAGWAMLNINGKKVYLVCGKTDMSKSINGLASIVESNFQQDFFSGAIFVFSNRNRDRIKILEWDWDGSWLYFKRLEKGRLCWQTEGREATMALIPEELQIPFGGAKVEL